MTDVIASSGCGVYRDKNTVTWWSLTFSMQFADWDRGKADRNLQKHGISFDEAATVFRDALSVTIADPDHSAEEERWIDIGVSIEGRLLVVVYAWREDTPRIISARRASAAERDVYEQDNP